ncbi:MAG: hypothetical protein EKK41_21740 [Hyphomicrobiales bacterium]|nr:MAG: hypothetical protein EKK41_21740 [Hyphomicrobiales bacterium]
MGLQIVLDATGDGRHTFNPADDKEIEIARNRFRRLVSRGYSAFDKQSGRRLSGFDPTVTETLFVPHLHGG